MSQEKGLRESDKVRVGKQDGMSRENGGPAESGERDTSRASHRGQGALEPLWLIGAPYPGLQSKQLRRRDTCSSRSLWNPREVSLPLQPHLGPKFGSLRFLVRGPEDEQEAVGMGGDVRELCFCLKLHDERGGRFNEMLLALWFVCCNMTLHDERGGLIKCSWSHAFV